MSIDEKLVTYYQGCLKDLDVFNSLCHRRNMLSFLFATAETNGYDMQRRPVIEFGAFQFAFLTFDSANEIYDPGVSHFLTLNRRIMGIDYHANDSSYTPELVDRNVQFLEQFGKPKQAYLYDRQTLERLASELKKVSLSFEEAASRTGAIIFSNHVLNEPSLKLSKPFWQLDGLHVHHVNIVELIENLGFVYEEFSKSDLGRALPRDSISYEASLDAFSLKLFETEPEFVKPLIAAKFGINRDFVACKRQGEVYALVWENK